MFPAGDIRRRRELQPHPFRSPDARRFGPEQRFLLALIFTLAVAAGTVAGLLVGWLADRFGSRPLVLFGGLAAGTGLVLSSPADSYWHFLLTFAVAYAGTTVGFSMITLLSTVNRWFSRRRPVAIATLMTMFSVGLAFVPLLVALGMGSVGWPKRALVPGCLPLRARRPRLPGTAQPAGGHGSLARTASRRPRTPRISRCGRPCTPAPSGLWFWVGWS